MSRCSSILAISFLMIADVFGSRSVHAEPIKPVPYVDLQRYMGDWYLIAHVPTSYEEQAYNAVETYTLRENGNVYTEFRFREGSFDGPREYIDSMARVREGTGNAVWAVHLFLWLDAQYVVAYLADDYSKVIVARDDRDYAWVMSRTPEVSDAEYGALMDRLEALDYDMDKVRRVPQNW